MGPDYRVDTKNALITGGAGFIGSNFVRMILQEHGKWEVTVLDACTYAGNLSNLEDCFDDVMFEFIKGDICDSALVDCLMCEMDLVINFAASTDVDRSIMSSGEFVRTNVEGTEVLAEAAMKHGVKQFIQLSTNEVYGSLSDNGYFAEDAALRPTNPYSASKAAADMMLLAFYETYKLPVIILRSTDNYGPYQFPEKMIPLFITNLLESKPVPLYGDGNQIRDWLHVDDHCRAILNTITYGQAGQVYNIGAHNEMRNVDVARMIIEQLGKDESYLKFVEDRPGHDRHYAVDTTKANLKLKWAPKIDFQTGLKNTIDWYVSHQDWWGKVKAGEYISYYERQYESRAIAR